MNNIVKECGTFRFHILALCIVFIWAVTFISTKELLMVGLSPSDILFYRFILAYIGLCICSHPFVPVAKSLKDEALLFMCGLFGGTLYFITENTALEFTLVSNVTLICSTTPLITLLFQAIIDRKKPKAGVIAGSLFSLFGVAAVIFNTNFIIRINPIGDLLCLASATSWTLYTLIIKRLSRRYTALFITRKTFFYGIITLIPILCSKGITTSKDILFTFPVMSRILFLGLIASFACFMLWNVCLKKLNAVVVSNYIYLMPVISILASNLLLGESLNYMIIIGTAFVLSGMFIAGRSKQ